MRADNRMVAGLIADALFQNSIPEYADRLVLTTKKGRDLGGWCKSAATDEIERVLNQWQLQRREVLP